MRLPRFFLLIFLLLLALLLTCCAQNVAFRVKGQSQVSIGAGQRL